MTQPTPQDEYYAQHPFEDEDFVRGYEQWLKEREEQDVQNH